MEERGYSVGNLDCTIIAQKPKLSPHKDRIRDNVALLLNAHPSVINIKVCFKLNNQMQAMEIHTH